MDEMLDFFQYPNPNLNIYISRLSVGNDRNNPLTTPGIAELDPTAGQRVEGEVAGGTYVQSSVDAGPALAHDHRAGLDQLAVELLYTQALAAGIAAVSRYADTFFMSHYFS
jgi:hypothetical protein